MKYLRRFSTLSRHWNKYSDTLQLPKTSFTPKIPSGERNLELIEKSTEKLYNWQRTAKSDSPEFILHDGPPYANGDLHLGHALNKVLKDFIIRYELLVNGKKIDYTPGWDCHGLPIEMKIMKKGEMNSVEIREACAELANVMIEKQKEQFKQFAIMTDFNNIYRTLNHSYEVDQLKVFIKLFENDLLSRQLKPVWWGCDTETALAEAELEYNPQHKSVAIHVKFKLNDNDILPANTYALIWTSTPWTIPGNRAICLNKDFEYTLVTNGQDYLITEQSLAPSILKLNEDFKATDIKVKGSSLLELTYTNPFTNESYPFLHADHVNSSSGTGLVHTAPAHGGDDHLIGKKHGLEISSLIDNKGRFKSIKNFEDLEGLTVNQPKTIKICVKKFAEKDMIFHTNWKFQHSYPYDWRSKTPVVQRATPQWFINVDKIRGHTLDALEKVEFIPNIGINRLKSFILNRTEWCISRQRSWGVPLPIIYYKDEPIMDLDIIKFIVSRIDELGTNAWFEVDNVLRWLPEGYAETHKLQVEHLAKSKDTMDVWFDSGTSWTTLKGRIADVYLEGSDQHRGWFQSSILNKVIASGHEGNFESVAPYKKIVTHGFTLDKNNDKMSKSLGNVIAPIDLLEGNPKTGLVKLGVDGLRLWIASSNYNNDIAISNEILKRVSDNLKKFKVTFKFLLGNLNDFAPSDENYETLSGLDKLMLSNLKQLQDKCEESYAKYNFQKVVKDVNNHMNVELSAMYFDISKDCLYTDKPDSTRRTNIQFVLRQVLKTYIGLLSPIMPVLTQDIWELSRALLGSSKESPFMEDWAFYKLPAHYENQAIVDQFDDVLKIREEAFSRLEELRSKNLFKKNLELSLELSATGPIRDILEESKDILADLFLVSDCTINQPAPGEVISSFNVEKNGAISATVRLSDKHKCPRCWKHTSVTEDTLCSKCEDAVHS